VFTETVKRQIVANPDGTFTLRVTVVRSGKEYFRSATVHKTREAAEAKR
jgi:hypothetical protein